MPLPDKLQAIVSDFAEAPNDLRVEMLFEFSESLPGLPEGMDASHGMEQVTECQSPFFLASEIADDGTVDIWFECPPEAPTTRGFAGILAEGLDGASADDILTVEDDFYLRMGLGDAISPLRLRGMSAILSRLKRQIAEALAAA